MITQIFDSELFSNKGCLPSAEAAFHMEDLFPAFKETTEGPGPFWYQLLIK